MRTLSKEFQPEMEKDELLCFECHQRHWTQEEDLYTCQECGLEWVQLYEAP